MTEVAGRLDEIEQARAPDNAAELEKLLQYRLSQILIAYHRQKRSAIILLEGWDAAGKGGLIKRLSGDLDPRFFEVVPVSAPNQAERGEHYMARFWRKLPPAGNWTIFDRTWYGRVLVERVEGYCAPDEWGRAYGEINALEKALVANGTRIVKLFLHVSQEEQDKRLIDRLEQPWKRWKVGPDDFRNRARRPDYLQAYEEMFARTDTEYAPWYLIGANHKKHARLAGLQLIVDRLSDGVDLSDPPLDPDLQKLAEAELNCNLRPG